LDNICLIFGHKNLSALKQNNIWGDAEDGLHVVLCNGTNAEEEQIFVGKEAAESSEILIPFYQIT